MNYLKKLLLVIPVIFTLPLQAASRTSTGITLLESPGARPAALGEAFSSVQNDISALGYNPASLSSLKTGHASFMYQRGLADDAFGDFRIGVPSGWGLSVGYYNGGDTEFSDGTTNRTVAVQKDLAASLGYARSLGNLSLGVAGKYLSSELAETAQASAYALDIGLQMPVGSRLHFGAAVQNIGSKIQYISDTEEMPLTARVGFSMDVMKATSLLLDGIYSKTTAELNPALGIESRIGPMALRAGYKTGSDLENLSVGAGFLISRFSFDYSFGLVQDLDSQHRISLSMRFGEPSAAQSQLTYNSPSQIELIPETPSVKFIEDLDEKGSQAQAETYKLRQEAALKNAQRSKSLGGKVYEVRAHDTLGKIAKQMYGDSREWKKIYEANRYLIGSSANLEIGQKLRLP